MADKPRRDQESKESFDEEFDEDFPEDEESARRSFFASTARKLFAAGIGAAFMTEESIRRNLKDLKLPGDVLNTLLASASKSKEDLMNVVTDEVVNVIKKIDFVEEASRFVEEHKFRISAEIEVVRKEEGDSSDGKEFSTKVKIR